MASDALKEPSLHSIRDPQREAHRWVESLSPNPWQGWLVLGEGMGFHLEELRLRYPTDSIWVIDFDQHLAPSKRWSSLYLPTHCSPDQWDSALEPLLSEESRACVRFFPAWSRRLREFHLLADRLRGAGTMAMAEKAALQELLR